MSVKGLGIFITEVIILFINADLRVWFEQPQRQLPLLHWGRGRRLRARQEVPLSRLLHGKQENGQTGVNFINRLHTNFSSEHCFGRFF